MSARTLVLRSTARSLVLSHLGYVRALARRERLRLGPRVEQEELVASGTLGLMEAAQRFDPARGLSFLTFAHHRIRGAMLDGLRALDEGPRRRAAGGERAPSPKRRDEDLEGLPGTFVDAEEALLRAERHQRLRAALARLPARERRLLEGCYFEDQTLAEAGSSLGLSRSWTCRLHARAVDHLRTAVEADLERREQLIRHLGQHRGNVTAVAAALGKARMQIQRWLKRYGIDPNTFRD